jgi:coenzyme F420-dependent glucose-6-phosphate dehydrogenase
MSTRYFFGAAHEEYGPDALLRHAVDAERAGFDGISCSDHLQPWWEPGESGHAWVWLGAAGQATDRVPIGTGVTPPGARYHPALIAQAWMTLERLLPGRPFLGIGSGEALNEVPVGDDWPSPADQIARMEEALGYIDRLWSGETVTEEGRFFRLRDCKLHTRADRRPPIWVSAFGPKAAEVAGRHGDALWTLPDPDSTPELIETFRETRRRAGRDGDGEIVFQAQVAWAESDEQALDHVRRWKGAQPEDHYTEDWHEPRKMYEHGEEETSDEELAQGVIASSNPEEIQERLREIERLGATVVVVQSSSPEPERAIQVLGGEVLPALRGARV